MGVRKTACVYIKTLLNSALFQGFLIYIKAKDFNPDLCWESAV